MSAKPFSLTVEHVRQIARAPYANDNMRSRVIALEKFGAQFELLAPHRLAHFLAQSAHESGGFKYDAEIWGPTRQQKKYDVGSLAKTLGNTPEADGDGEKYKGRTDAMITGKDNYRTFRDWCRMRGYNTPDFVTHPEMINDDPWEGLALIWYWQDRGLNRYADTNDIEMITRRINGGLNGFADRVERYTISALVLLGYAAAPSAMKGSVTAFQAKAQSNGWLPQDVPGEPSQVDGVAGPKTRAAFHKALVAMGGRSAVANKAVRAAPVVEIKKVAAAPEKAEKPGKAILMVIVTAISGALNQFMDLDIRVQFLIGAVVVLGLVLIVTGQLNLAKEIRNVRKALEAEA